MKRTLFITGVACVMCAAAMFKWLPGSGSWHPSRFPPPWADGKPIYEHVRAHIDPTGGLRPGGEELPDEPRISTGSGVRWAPGAMDGVLGHHMNPSEQKNAVQAALKRLEAVLKRPDERCMRSPPGIGRPGRTRSAALSPRPPMPNHPTPCAS